MTTDQLPATADEVIDAFFDAHAAYPQYEGWLEQGPTEVRRVTRTIGGDGTFVRAEIGDLVLVRWAEPRGYLTTIPNYDSIFCPRVGWIVAGRASWETEALPA